MPVDRPANLICPRQDCHSIKIHSSHPYWRCTNCGEQWLKKPRPPKKFTKEFLNRPKCSECGTIPRSSHPYWRCTNCGHQWIKRCRDKRKKDYTNRPPCPYCGEYEGRMHLGTTEKPVRLLCVACHRSYSVDYAVEVLLSKEVEVFKNEKI